MIFTKNTVNAMFAEKLKAHQQTTQLNKEKLFYILIHNGSSNELASEALCFLMVETRGIYA
jgi:hypothetical protein